jgi:hypothetical protein
MVIIREVARIGGTRCYQVRRPGIRTLAGLLILREKVLKPVLAGVCRPKRGRPPKNIHPLDEHYQNPQREMPATLQTLKPAA